LRKIFALVRRLRSRTEMPIAFMTYYNPVLQYGLDAFCRDCRRSGVDGVIVPDLPCEESRILKKAAADSDVATIFLAAPTSTAARMKDIAKNSAGFIYYVSLTGVTGARKNLPDEISSKVRLLKSFTKKPVCVGFGVSNPHQAKTLAKVADGVIVGSAVVKIIASGKNIIPKISRFAGILSKAIHSA
jgi:tryptophan synthase alpha chain